MEDSGLGDASEAPGVIVALSMGEGLAVALCVGLGVVISAEGEGEGDAPGLTLHEQAVRAAVARMKTSVNASFLFKGFASFGPYCAPCAPVAYLKRCKFFLLDAPLQKVMTACIIG